MSENSVKIVLFGKNGMLGSDLVRHRPSEINLSAFGREVDITESSRVEEVFKRENPMWAINAVAYNKVDAAEKEGRAEAFRVNAEGPKLLAEICERRGIPLIHFSTDYVFSGGKKDLYVEEDDPNPLGAYARSKLEGEKGVQVAARHYILRVNTLYGTGRSNHALKVREALKVGKSIKVATDLMGSPSYTGDLALWVYGLVKTQPKYGIYHLSHMGVCSRFGFAEKLCQKSGKTPPFPIQKITLKELDLPAPRPKYLGLSTEKWQKNVGKLCSWENGLDHFLKHLNQIYF